jgi:hypothetical protein
MQGIAAENRIVYRGPEIQEPDVFLASQLIQRFVKPLHPWQMPK